MEPEYAIRIFGIPFTVFISAVIFAVISLLIIFFLIREGKNYFKQNSK